MKIAGVLLGGGRSRRFGSNKLEARIGGRRLLDVACAHFLEAGLDPVVFCGRDRPEDARVRVVEPGAEMIDTLRNGLRAIPDMAFAFAPADMPRLAAELIRRLADAFSESGKPYLVPVCSGRRGHPAFARTKEPFWSVAQARDAWRDAGDDLVHFEVDTPDILFDVDTPADL